MSVNGISGKAFDAHPVEDREGGSVGPKQIDTHVVVKISKIISMIECPFDIIGCRWRI